MRMHVDGAEYAFVILRLRRLENGPLLPDHFPLL